MPLLPRLLLRKIGLVIVLTACIQAAKADALSQRIEYLSSAIQQISRSELSSSEQAQRISQDYLQQFATHPAWREVSDGELRAFFALSAKASFYSDAPVIVQQLSAALYELAARKLASAADIQLVDASLISTNQFVQAQALRLAFPEANLSRLPSISHPPEPGSALSFWQIAGESLNDLQLRGANLQFAKGVQVVVLSHPDCHFSRRLFQALQQDPELRQHLPKQTLWLAPANRDTPIARLWQWNQTQPEFHHVLSYQASAWPFISDIATPSLFIFKDGVLKGSVIGWPKEGRKQELLEGLANASRN